MHQHGVPAGDCPMRRLVLHRCGASRGCRIGSGTVFFMYVMGIFVCRPTGLNPSSATTSHGGNALAANSLLIFVNAFLGGALAL
jgi:hypothetical protein